MVDHYGNEHYCPLTFVRILGNVVIDEIDEEAEDAEPSIDEDAPTGGSDASNFIWHRRSVLTWPVTRLAEIDSDGLLTKAKGEIMP